MLTELLNEYIQKIESDVPSTFARTTISPMAARTIQSLCDTGTPLFNACVEALGEGSGYKMYMAKKAVREFLGSFHPNNYPFRRDANPQDINDIAANCLLHGDFDGDTFRAPLYPVSIAILGPNQDMAMEKIKAHLARVESNYPYAIRQPQTLDICRVASACKSLNVADIEAACYLVLGPAKCRYPTPATVRRAFAWEDTTILTDTGHKSSINISSIASRLIQEVGRYTESYASDFLFNWAEVERIIKEAEPGDNSIVTFGIRKQGVDHTTFLMSHLSESCHKDPNTFLHPEQYYRKVYALRITCNDEGYIRAELKNITCSLHHLSKEDINWNPDEHTLPRYSTTEVPC